MKSVTFAAVVFLLAGCGAKPTTGVPDRAEPTTGVPDSLMSKLRNGMTVSQIREQLVGCEVRIATTEERSQVHQVNKQFEEANVEFPDGILAADDYLLVSKVEGKGTWLTIRDGKLINHQGAD